MLLRSCGGQIRREIRPLIRCRGSSPDGRAFAYLSHKKLNNRIRNRIEKYKNSCYNKTEKQCPLAEPDLLMVITGGELGYTNKDGVHIVPISALKP